MLVLESAAENPVAFPPGGFQVAGAEVPPYAELGVVRTVDGVVQPPGAVVVPEMVVVSRGFLAAGNGGGVRIHGDVVVWLTTPLSPQIKTPGPRTSVRASEISGETFVGRVCLVPLPHPGLVTGRHLGVSARLPVRARHTDSRDVGENMTDPGLVSKANYRFGLS